MSYFLSFALFISDSCNDLQPYLAGFNIESKFVYGSQNLVVFLENSKILRGGFFHYRRENNFYQLNSTYLEQFYKLSIKHDQKNLGKQLLGIFFNKIEKAAISKLKISSLLRRFEERDLISLCQHYEGITFNLDHPLLTCEFQITKKWFKEFDDNSNKNDSNFKIFPSELRFPISFSIEIHKQHQHTLADWQKNKFSTITDFRFWIELFTNELIILSNTGYFISDIKPENIFVDLNKLSNKLRFTFGDVEREGLNNNYFPQLRRAIRNLVSFFKDKKRNTSLKVLHLMDLLIVVVNNNKYEHQIFENIEFQKNDNNKSIAKTIIYNKKHSNIVHDFFLDLKNIVMVYFYQNLTKETVEKITNESIGDSKNYPYSVLSRRIDLLENENIEQKKVNIEQKKLNIEQQKLNIEQKKFNIEQQKINTEQKFFINIAFFCFFIVVVILIFVNVKFARIMLFH